MDIFLPFNQEILQEDGEKVVDLDIVIKLYIKRLNNSQSAIYYPNFRLNPVYLKNVVLKIKPVKNEISLCENLLGIFPDLAYDPENNYHKIIVQGLAPKFFSHEHKNQLKMGDLIVSINNVEVNSENIQSILSALNQKQLIKIRAVSALNYPNTTFKQEQQIDSNKIVAYSKSSQVILGDRVKFNDNIVNIEDISYLVMVLAFDNRNKQNQDYDTMKDLIYKYPKNEENINRKMSGINELIKTIRGLFVTLAYAIKEISKNEEAVCCMIEHQDQLYHVCFLHENYSKSGILTLIIPLEQINMSYLKILAKILNKTFKFTFGNLFNRLIDENLENRLSESEKQDISSELDNFFSQIKSRFFQTQSNSANFLNRSTSTLIQQQQQLFQRQQESIRRMNLLNEMRSKFFDSVPYLDLPFPLKSEIDSALNDLEAQEFVDLDNSCYLNRRLFTITGSCLFYKDYLVTTHLNSQKMASIYNYLEHYGLFNLVRNGCINQTVIWREVYISSDSAKNTISSSSRHFLIIIGLKEFLFGVLLESGGIIARQIDPKYKIAPNPFYIQQATFVLNDLFDSGLLSEINRYYNFTSGRQIIFNINKYVKFKPTKIKNQQNIKLRESSKSKSPTRISLQNMDRSRSYDQSRQKTAAINQVENVRIDDLETNNEAVYQYHKEHRHKSPLKSNQTYLTDNECFRYFKDVSLNESIIYYASDTYNTNGIIFSPKKYDYGSNLFIRVFSNYIQACFKIKNLFDISFETTQQGNSTDSLIEQGILFNLVLPDESNASKMNSDKADQKNTSMMSSFATPCSTKVKELTFWVVGRRRMKRMSPNSPWKSLGDFFVCFHDSADQILLELAFDIGACKIAV